MGGEKLEGSRHLPHTATTAASSMACSLPGPRRPAATVGAQSVHHIMSQDTGELILESGFTLLPVCWVQLFSGRQAFKLPRRQI